MYETYDVGYYDRGHINIYRVDGENVLEPLGAVYRTNISNTWSSATIRMSVNGLTTLKLMFEAVIYDQTFNDIGLDEIDFNDCLNASTGIVIYSIMKPKTYIWVLSNIF